MFIAILCAILIIIYIIERHSVNNALTGIEYSQYTLLTIVEPDEEFEIISVLQNKTRRFISFLKLCETFSAEVQLKLKDIDNKYISKYDDSYHSSQKQNLQTSHYLMPKQKLERRMKASVYKRGRYFLYGAIIYGGDFLGISETLGDYSSINEIVVMPKETSIPEIEVKLSGFVGDVSVNRFIFEDPILTLGFNDYTGQEPQKMISWTQTARVGHLMVKKYDYTLELLVTVVLNIDYEGKNSDLLVEECFCIARSVCQMLESKNIRYGFITNAEIAGAKPMWENYADGSGSHYLMSILESLGRALHMISEPFDKIMDKALDYAEPGRGYVIITPEISEGCTYIGEQLKSITGIDACVLTAKQGGE